MTLAVLLIRLSRQYYLGHDCNVFIHLVYLQRQVLPYALKDSSSTAVVDSVQRNSFHTRDIHCLMTQVTEGLY